MNNKIRLVIVKCILFGIFLFNILNISCGQEQMYSSDFYLQKYEEYLKSLQSKSIGFSYQNTFPDSTISGEVKHNGKYFLSILFNDSDAVDIYARESIGSEKGYQMLEYNKSKTEMILYSYLDPSKDKNYSFKKSFPIPILLGFVDIRPVWENAFIPQLLREMNVKVTKVTKNSMELILLSGQKDNLTVSIWLDPALNFPMRFLEVHQSNVSKTGDLIEMSKVFDDFIDRKGIKFPTHYEVTLSQVGFKDTGVLKNTIAMKLDNITITDNSNPKPFSFKTKIPNGTKAILFDAQQIEHVWMDGKIVPKTDEIALAIARGDYKFIPGPNEPRFWFIALGLILIFLSVGLKLRDMLKESNQKKDEKHESNH